MNKPDTLGLGKPVAFSPKNKQTQPNKFGAGMAGTNTHSQITVRVNDNDSFCPRRPPASDTLPSMNSDVGDVDRLPLVDDELTLLASLVPLPGSRLVEVGCGNARLLRQLVQRFGGVQCAALEVDRVQLARNLAERSLTGLHFIEAGAAAMPLGEGWADGVLMLKSLHHVPLADLDTALDEVARVLRPGGWFYVSEPIYAGALNELIRLFNDEGVVRAAAQAALDRALARGHFRALSEHRFAQAVSYPDVDSFEQRMMRPSFADHRLTSDLINAVRQRFAPHCGPQGAHFVRPMHVRLLQRV